MPRQTFFPNPDNKPNGFSPVTRAGNTVFTSGQVSVDVARDPELVRLMARSGCITALVGFESLDSSNLVQMKKGWNTKHGSYDTAVKVFQDVGILKDLGDGDWDKAIDGLTTTLQTFRLKSGTFEALSSLNRDISGTNPAEIVDSDTAVDSYALSAVGFGSGYVTIIRQNGNPPFTPEGDPVDVQILKVGGGLYQGQVKAMTPSNPLSEQVSLQHTGETEVRARSESRRISFLAR